MKHRVAGRKLGRTSSHRLALLRNLTTQLFAHERITTTLMKAKEMRPFAERLLTLAKRETLHARRQVLRHVHDKEVVGKLFDTLSARYAQRPGGYTRIVKLGPRRGDAAEMAIVELVDSEPKASKAPAPEKEKGAKPPKAEKKAKVAKKAGAAEEKPAKKAAPKKPKAAPKVKAESKAKTRGGKAAGSTPRKSGGA
jgi:large subunit ribosomal protein L17